MKKRICIHYTLDIVDLDRPISEIAEGGVHLFNHKEFHLEGAIQDWEENALKLYVYHPEFPKVEQGERCPHYHCTEARKKFPYLFVDTNPILYRKFT